MQISEISSQSPLRPFGFDPMFQHSGTCGEHAWALKGKALSHVPTLHWAASHVVSPRESLSCHKVTGEEHMLLDHGYFICAESVHLGSFLM